MNPQSITRSTSNLTVASQGTTPAAKKTGSSKTATVNQPGAEQNTPELSTGKQVLEKGAKTKALAQAWQQDIVDLENKLNAVHLQLDKLLADLDKLLEAIENDSKNSSTDISAGTPENNGKAKDSEGIRNYQKKVVGDLKEIRCKLFEADKAADEGKTIIVGYRKLLANLRDDKEFKKNFPTAYGQLMKLLGENSKKKSSVINNRASQNGGRKIQDQKEISTNTAVRTSLPRKPKDRKQKEN